MLSLSACESVEPDRLFVDVVWGACVSASVIAAFGLDDTLVLDAQTFEHSLVLPRGFPAFALVYFWIHSVVIIAT